MPKTATAPAPRRRNRSSRALDLGNQHSNTGKPTKVMKDTAVELFLANEEKNAMGRKESKLKKGLASLMAKSVGLFSFTTPLPDGRTIRVNYEAGESSSVDMQTLINEVGADKVLAIANVTQSDVKDAFGSSVLNKCLKYTTTDPAIKVKEEKNG